MPRARTLALLLLLAALGVASPARADQSANVKHLANVVQPSAIGLAFLDDTMFVTTATGVYSYDIGDPANPTLLGALPMYIWENEDMDIDVRRKRIFISRDPRGFTTPATPGSTFPYGAVHTIDVSDPANLRQIGFFLLPAGHTSTCINDCDVLWTAGPGANAAAQPADYVGRPVYGTDVTDPANPKPCPEPIDTGRNDGVTDYAHDVQVDAQGIAWVSGAGGVRGYWTRGTHKDPVTGATREATGCAPIPYGGSGTPETATSSRFMHNSWRDYVAPPASAPDSPTGSGVCASRRVVTLRLPRGSKAKGLRVTVAGRPVKGRFATRGGRLTVRVTLAGLPKGAVTVRVTRGSGKARRTVTTRRYRLCTKRAAKTAAPRAASAAIDRNDVLLATEENIVSDCATSGRFAIYDLRGTYDGEGFKDIAKTKHRMKVLDTWTPESQEGASGCASSHYFASRGDGITVNAFYEQGVRFLDTSDPTDIRQIGYYREADSNTFAAYFHKGKVYVADFGRGIDVLEFDGRPGRSATVRVPAAQRAARQKLEFGPSTFGGLCPLNVPIAS